MKRCEFCNSEFKSKYTLKTHMTTAKYCLSFQENKVNIPIFKCDLCDKSLTSKSRLIYHMNTHFSKTCEHCNKTFKSQKKFDQHTVTCVELLKFKIEKQEIQLKSIQNIVTDNNSTNSTQNTIHKCKYCNKVFSFKQSKYDHQKNYCKEKRQ